MSVHHRVRCTTFSGVLMCAAALVGLAPASASAEAADRAASVDARLDKPYRAFLHDLQAAVAGHAREQIAAMVGYPLKAKIKGRAARIDTPSQFLSHYDQLLPPDTRQLIVPQSYEGLFANSQGVMIGSGEVWFGRVCRDASCGSRAIRIIALNLLR